MRGRPGRDSLYSIPSGGWFDLVSCPHYAAEILIYTALIVLTGGRNVTLLYVVLVRSAWVLLMRCCAGSCSSSLY